MTGTSRPTAASPTPSPTGSPAPPRLMVSAAADRSQPVPLEGATVSGAAHVFVAVAAATTVEFWIDTPAPTSSPYTVERSAPWDLAGGSAAAATPFDTRVLANGTHTLLTRVTTSTATRTLAASFTVANALPVPPSTSPAPTPKATVSCTVRPTVWQGGYVLNLDVRNEGPAAVSRWAVRLSYTQRPAITNSWNATFTSSDLVVTGTNLAGNGSLEAGQAVGIGVQGTWAGTWTAPGCTASATPASADTGTRTTCDNGGSIKVGTYWAYDNQWGAGTGTGKQCVSARAWGPDGLAWSTDWQWSGEQNKVKSYAAAVTGWHWGWPVAGSGLPLRVADVTAIPARWQYDLDLDLSSLNQLNVAYDIWTSTEASAPGGPADEIMVWNYRTGGIRPVGSRQTTVRIDGADWEVWRGAHTWNVLSFVRLDPKPDDDLQLDLKHFLDDLVRRGWLPSSRYVVGIEAGSEVFLGKGDLTTSFYSVSPR
ncbi:MAG: cellulose binding domain-containing protein [Kineosporiaceae bacterium]